MLVTNLSRVALAVLGVLVAARTARWKRARDNAKVAESWGVTELQLQAAVDAGAAYTEQRLQEMGEQE